MIFRRASSCAGHRAALVDFVDRRERGPGTDLALAHLDVCRSCLAELSGISLAITALRRIRAEVERAEPSGDAWERVRRVAERPRVAPWRWRLSLGGTVVAAALAAVMVMPSAFGRLAAPSLLIAGDEGSAIPSRASAGSAPATRLYDPPAGALTARVVTILAGDERIDRPLEARALTLLPTATDRHEPERARPRALVSGQGTLTRAATRE